MQRVVGVKSPSSKKVHFCLVNDLNLEKGQGVIIDSEFGEIFGVVATQVKEIDNQDDIRKVVRVATDKDIKLNDELVLRGQKAVQIAREKVKKLGLEMKIVSAEYTFDQSKVIIEFSADERVDFRELLKELASALKVRIELRQVGQRDEVKVRGGIGPCGQICCCTRFLNDFEHVTVKMAKTQGLSLSPTKISGLCGRLMCCLGYENATYEEILKKMPKINSEIDSPKGRGVVVYNDILRERVSVKVQGSDDSYTVYDFALEELTKQPEVSKKEEKKPEKEAQEVQNKGESKPRHPKNKNFHKIKKEGNKNGVSNN